MATFMIVAGQARPHYIRTIETEMDAEDFWDGSTLDERENYGLKQSMTSVELEKWFQDLDADAKLRAFETLKGQIVNWTE